MSAAERSIAIRSGDLTLEGMLHEGDADFAALVLHPHPQYGGDMDNHVVVAICDGLAACGATTLRLNFRGAGGSEGTFDDGRGEVADAIAAVTQLRRGHEDRRLVLAGYSFGATIAATAAASVAPTAIILVSPPVAYSPLTPWPDATPALIIAGDRDDIAPADAVRAMASATTDAIVVPGVDHGWWPGIDLLAGHVTEFVETRIPPLSYP